MYEEEKWDDRKDQTSWILDQVGKINRLVKASWINRISRMHRIAKKMNA